MWKKATELQKDQIFSIKWKKFSHLQVGPKF